MPNIIRYKQPLMSIFDEFEKNVNRFLSPYFKKDIYDISNYWSPDIDIKEDESRYIVTADIPGMEKKDIKIGIDQFNNLVIEGERGAEIKKEAKGYLCYERNKGMFLRKITLPYIVDVQSISAQYQNGVLEINIPKTKESAFKQIDIKT